MSGHFSTSVSPRQPRSQGASASLLTLRVPSPWIRPMLFAGSDRATVHFPTSPDALTPIEIIF
jgi:hypothetical protein